MSSLKYASFKYRIFFIMILFFLLYACIGFNLFFIQIGQAHFFATLADKQYTVVTTQIPIRAPILDRKGCILAAAQDSVAAFIIPRLIKDHDRVNNFLGNYFPEALNRLYAYRQKHFMYVKRRLSSKEIELIQNSGITDIKLLQEPNRYYPSETTASLVGITNIDNQGVCGIEKVFDKQLSGTPTTITLKKDGRSEYFSIESKINIKGNTGSSIMLTIDATLQFLVYEELQDALKSWSAQDGGALILDPSNGDILAMVSLPSFDPNSTKNLDIELTKNRCVTDMYEFGSVIKIFAALAAIEEKVVTPDEEIDCENTKSTIINGIRVNNWSSDGVIPFSKVLARSNNIGIAKVTQRLGKKLYEHYRRLGFCQKTNIALPGETIGFVTPPHAWSKQSIFSLSYGYEVSISLLQLARAWGIIANGGYFIQPRITLSNPSSTTDPTHSLCLLPMYKPATIRTIRSIAQETVDHGTAYRTHLDGYTIMGKTGTANLLKNGTYDKTRDIYSFAGIVEKGDYKRVIAVYLKNIPNNKHLFASKVVVPLFKSITQKMLIHEKVL